MLLGKNGVEKILRYGDLSDFEEATLNAAISTLKTDISIGEDFIN